MSYYHVQNANPVYALNDIKQGQVVFLSTDDDTKVTWNADGPAVGVAIRDAAEGSIVEYAIGGTIGVRMVSGAEVNVGQMYVQDGFEIGYVLFKGGSDLSLVQLAIAPAA